MTPDTTEELIDLLAEQAEDLCHIHDHLIRVIAAFDVPISSFSGYEEEYRAKYELEGIIKMFLYQHARGLNQSELARRLRGATFVYQRFELSSPPVQQIISHNWRNRINREEPTRLKEAAERINAICAEHDIREAYEPALSPDDIEEDIGEDQIRDAVQRAVNLGLDGFIDPRADNITYPLEAYFERQSYLNLAKAGTTTKARRFARLSDRSEVPHGATHNRTLKKLATPEEQTKLWDFIGDKREDWKAIRDTVLPAFHIGVENILNALEEGDNPGIPSVLV